MFVKVNKHSTFYYINIQIIQIMLFCGQGRNKGRAKGAQFPERRITMGAPNHCEGRRMTSEGAEKSQ